MAAAFLFLRGFGVFRLPWFRGLTSFFGRGDSRHWTLLIFCFALALRLGYASVAPPPPVADEACYDALARSLATGRGYVLDGVPTAYWTVGCSGLIAAFYVVFGFHYLPVIIFQAVLGAATAVLTWRLASLFWEESSARVAGLIVAVLPSQVAYAARLYPAVVFGFVTVTASYLMLSSGRKWAAAAAGLLVGAGALSAPIALTLPVPFLWMDLSSGRGWKRAGIRFLLVIFVAAAVVAPWTYRNWRVLNAFVPVSTNGGVNLWMGNNAEADGSYYFPSSPTNPLYSVRDEVRRDSLGRKLAWDFIRRHPETFLKLTIPKFAKLYATDTSAFQYGAKRYGVDVAVSGRRFPARLAQSVYALLWVGFIVGLFKCRRQIFSSIRGKLPVAAALAVPFFLTAAYLVFVSLDRYHFPMVPFMAVVAAGSIWASRVKALTHS